jgi:FlaA1/EpsC-like NDP-sugar epimerase
MKNSTDTHRALIVGAGVAGREALRAIQRDRTPSLRIVGFIDDNRRRGEVIMGTPVFGGINDLRSLINKKKIDQILIAIPSAEGGLIRRIINGCNNAKVSFRIIPRVLEIIEGRVRIDHVRDVRPEDLLGRAIVKAEQRYLRPLFQGKTILVTGAAGSIGSELCRQIAQYQPYRLIAVDWWENGLYEFELDVIERYPKLSLRSIIANIQDDDKIKTIFRTHHPDLVFHAAAYKHVPLMEHHPEEALKNNILGTWNVASIAKRYRAKKFILISTDKAVNPTSVMGATKAVAEILVHSLNGGGTVFSSVRFGNVLASHGSVIPLFQRQIRRGGPVTITHPDMIRYFMSIPESVQLILQAARLSRHGEVFVLDMGEPVKILDLARNLIRLSGYRPDIDIPIRYIGFRPGEKLYEETLTQQEGMKCTKWKSVFVATKVFDRRYSNTQILRSIKRLSLASSHSEIRQYLRTLLPTYHQEAPTQTS